MEMNQRFAILTFPQFFDGNTLGVNVVFLPRNQNPLMSAIDGVPPLAGAAPFADAKLSFVARIVSGLAGLPGATPALAPRPLVTAQPTQARPLYEALANQFKITNLGVPNTNLNVNSLLQIAPPPGQIGQEIPAAHLSERVQLRRPAHAECRDRRCLPLRGARRHPESGVQTVAKGNQLGPGLCQRH